MVIPVVFLLVVLFLLVVPLYAAPYDTGMGMMGVMIMLKSKSFKLIP